MITDEETKQAIIKSLTIEKCEVCIKNMLIQIRNNVDSPNWLVINCSETIEYYMDCMKVLREEEELIKAYPAK